MFARNLLVLTYTTVVLASPAHAAAESAQVPEASSLTLFGLGLAGVIIGRRFSTRKRDDTPDGE